MRFHYISDLHLERRAATFPKFLGREITSKLPLFLAGDIGNPKSERYVDFLSETSERYKHVFLIAGNHEFGRAKHPASVEAQISEVARAFPNVSFLNRKCMEYEGHMIAGCTLWTPATCAAEFIENKYFLYKCRARAAAAQKKLLIMTHHMPSYELIIPKYRINNAYKLERWASNSEDLFGSSTSVWICGHSHMVFSRKINGTQVLINSLGSKVREFTL